MTVDPNREWQNVVWWVRFYSWLTLAVVLYGIAVAHVPFLIGHPWTSCEDGGSPLACVLTFHLYEVPLVTFNGFIGWFGLKRFTYATSGTFSSLLNFAVTVNLVFFTFECILLYLGIERDQPLWETLGLFSVAIALCGGSFLGMYVHQKIKGFFRGTSELV